MTEAYTSRPAGRPGSSFDRVLAAVTAAGLRHRLSRGTHIQAECPTHADEKPSLSIDYMPGDGLTTMLCQTRVCATEDILAALELTKPMLYDDYEEPEEFAARRAREREEERRTGRRRGAAGGGAARPTRRPEPKPRPALPKGRLPGRITRIEPRPVGEWSVTTTYDYCDHAATLVHQEVRHERLVEVVDPETGEVSTRTEKRFTQRWPDDRGGWQNKTPAGFVPVLYRLPDVAEWVAEGRPIWLCEGAKDAERFLDLDEAATTNPSGAGNFKPEQAAALAGAHVVVVLDHDLAGYRRGAKLATLLTETSSTSGQPVASLRFVLPVTAGRHEDASDHFDSGHGLDDFSEVTLEELALLERVADAEEAALLADEATAEATARAQRAQEASTEAQQGTERRYASRWAAEAGKQLVRATTALEAAAQTAEVAENLRERLLAAVRACQSSTLTAHDVADVDLPTELDAYLQAPAFPSPSTAAASELEPGGRTTDGRSAAGEDLDDEVDEVAGADSGAGSNVVEHPTSRRLPEPTAEIQMSRGVWAYELGGQGRRRRGVYQLADGRWVLVAPLPYLHARIVGRDGYGRRTGTYYLVSAQQDGDRVLLGHDELVRHTWPNMLDLAISHDDKILKAATTALTFAAQDETELVEATPRIGTDGKINAPIPETLPPGYLRTSELERDQALREWAELIGLAAQSPRIALVLGAAAIGPFLHGLGYQSHIVSMHGDMNQGKSVTMETAAAIWGNPGDEAGGGVKMSWNMSGQGPTSFLGELGTLPAFFDEHGMAAPKSPSEWGELIFRITQGASRGRPAPNGRIGFHSGRQWHGVLISSGNGRLMDGIGAGDKSGTQRRVVELPTPFTLSQEHSELIEQRLPAIYGHIGQEILARHSVDTVRTHARRAAELIGPFEHDSKTGQRMLEHMQAHVAGALLLDEICGTTTLTEAALAGAREYLADWTAPVHDADRIVEWISDSLFREPARWPTVAQHLESIGAAAPWDADTPRSGMPAGGIDRNRLGAIANDSSWLGVFTTAWTAMCKELDVDSDVACRELIERGLLLPQSSSKSTRGNKTNQANVKIGKAVRVYKFDYPGLMLAALDEDPGDVDGGPDGGPDGPSADSGPTLPTDGGQSDDQPGGASGGDVAGEPSDEHAQPSLIDPDEAAQAAVVTASMPEVTGGVTGEVTGTTPPLTCEVTGVTGDSGKISRGGAGARKSNSHPADRDAEIVRLEADEPKPPCVVCGTQAGQLVDGVPVHLGPCLDDLPTVATNDDDADDEDAATTDAAAGQVVDAAPATTPSTPTSEARPAPARPTGSASGQREARFTAPAACLDAEGIHLADGSTKPWPTVGHLGDLALLTGRDQLRLGWGGGEDRLPDQGQVWLFGDALERLGLPREQPALPDKALTKAQRAKATAKIYAELDEHPMVAGALADGWQLGQGGHLDVWTRIWHPELLPQGALIVGLPWHRIEGVALFEGDPTPGELARRLLLFAQRVGVAYRITSAATGLDLIDHHRPPRRSLDDDRGQSRRRVALIKRTPPELPPWRMKTSDARFTGLEQDLSWWRPWEQLGDSEKALRYVHGYDRNASYLVPWRSIELGVEGLVHRTSDDPGWVGWDGKEKPGYYLIDDRWEWPTWALPDPGTAAGARVGKGRMWVTVHTLRQLAAHGIEPTVHESYTWDVTARYLEGPGTALAEARATLLDAAAGPDADPGARAVLDTVKSLYSATVGKLAEREHAADFHLWRPDWRDHVIGATKTAILHTITKAHETTGVSPLVVDRDAVFYASNDPDPVTAWPGEGKKLGTGLGAWKPIGTTELATWGPAYLPKRTGRWHYADAVEALQSLQTEDGASDG